MASSNVSLEATLAEAAQTFSSAVAAAGGCIRSTIPGQPIQFRLTRTCNVWNDGVKALIFEGQARLSQAGSNQTRIDIDLRPASSYFWNVGTIGLVLFFITTSVGTFILPPGLWLIILLGFIGWKVYQSTTPWANETMDGLLTILSRSPEFTTAAPSSMPMAPVSPVHPPTSPFEPPPAAVPPSAEPSSEAAEQLVKLADLHKAGILTDSEYADKKAEVLKRM